MFANELVTPAVCLPQDTVGPDFAKCEFTLDYELPLRKLTMSFIFCYTLTELYTSTLCGELCHKKGMTHTTN